MFSWFVVCVDGQGERRSCSMNDASSVPGDHRGWEEGDLRSKESNWLLVLSGSVVLRTKVIYQPSMIRMENTGIHEKTYNSLMKGDVDIRKRTCTVKHRDQWWKHIFFEIANNLS
ncbi:hypothetical protein Bca4012_027425 [Brassica carinata]|uniref:Uncharacterized protein n=1 Tax=Brassica carinata TaxID=52824 RepID=A0A8X7VK87_BRACI|nr:hypothetical protein Bca52824_024413 [Brassica carinata]